MLREKMTRRNLREGGVPTAVLRIRRVGSIIFETEHVGRHATEAEVRDTAFCGCWFVPHGGMNMQRAYWAMLTASWGVKTARRGNSGQHIDASISREKRLTIPTMFEHAEGITDSTHEKDEDRR